MSHVLIVDDKEENLYYLSALLTGHGYGVTSARHGAEALVKARQAPPDIVISDLLMPVMDGYTLLRHWKADAQLKKVPFIVYTATYTEEEDEKLAHSLGADAFILKPAEPEDFLARLREVQVSVAMAVPTLPKEPLGDEKDLLEVYNKTLIRKLEEKTLQLEETNQALLQDIAKRKLAEEQLRANEERLNEAQHLAQMGSWIWTPDGTLIWSETMYQLFGMSRDTTPISERFLAAVHPDDRQRIRDDFLEWIASDRTSMEMEYRLLTADSGLRRILGIGHVERNAEGRAIRATGTCQDVTVRRQAEEEARWRTALFEALMVSSIDGILVVDSQGKIILQNQRVNELWKVPRHLATNMSEAEQLQLTASRTKNPQHFANEVAYLNSHPDVVGHDEVELIDGTLLDRTSWPIRDQAGVYYGRIWYFRDITERRKLETQFRQAQKMEAIGQLAGGVAHDFNNILAVILMQASLMTVEDGISDRLRTVAGEIEKAAQRAANLTRQLLLFSRQQTMQPHDLDLNDIVTNITKMLQRILGENIPMQFKLSPVPLVIYADAGMMDQILLNLTVNARDAMPAGGELIIETSAVEFDETTAAQASQGRLGSFACVSVTDTGCGIPPEILTRIFEPFFTTKDVGKGTGIGLATVFGITQQHQGWINVYSEVGKGTTFRVYLPRQTGRSNGPGIRPTPASVRGGNETILLLEDDSSVRSALQNALSSLGYRVLEASNGSEALEVWGQHRHEINLLLTDLVIPGGMTGRELAEKLLEQEPGLKIIYSSGYSAEIASKQIVLEEGVNFLAKPFETSNLARTVRNRLDAP